MSLCIVRCVEAHTDCKLYCIAGPELINECTPDIVDIMRKASQFKLEFYKASIFLSKPVSFAIYIQTNVIKKCHLSSKV